MNDPSAAPRKVIGRILSLGFPLPGPQVDNYSFLSAPSFFDYDAMVVDPHALSQIVEGVVDGSVEAATFADVAIRDEPASPVSASLVDVLLRRRDETARLLANGGVIVCFAHPPDQHDAIAGSGPLDDYFWLPGEAAAACRAPALTPGDGTQAYVVDYVHPLASFVLGQLANVLYRAHFDEKRISSAHVFARSHGGAAIGIDIAVGEGRVVMLPALRAVPAGDARYAMSDALQAGIRRALGVMAAGREPYWMRDYALPGLEARESALSIAREARGAAQTALEQAERACEELARYRRLLWQEGAVGLNEIVVEALRLIGFEVYAQDPNAIELRTNDTSVLVEIEGSEHPIDLAPHYRLRQRIEQAIERRGTAPRGLVIANGRRLAAPGDRGDGIGDALRLASETMRYAIAPTPGLFGAVAAQLAGEDSAVAAYRCRLLATDGILEGVAEA
ncbi:MAG: hypothetical protein M3P30_05365 [Chloroflexota bacterium]|nr:hypothetical protein [Chloroflexota bacterium]